MGEQVREPLLSDAQPANVTSIEEHRQHWFRKRLKAWSVGIMEDDQVFLRSGWSRRPYLGYILPAFFAIAAFWHLSFGFTFTVMVVIAVVMNTLVVACLDKGSLWLEALVCAECICISAAMSYRFRVHYYSTLTQAIYSLILTFFGLRTRHLALAVVLVFALFDRSTFGLPILAMSLVSLFVCNSLVQSFFYTAFLLQRSQDALIQYASDGFCSVSGTQGHFVFSCSRFLDIFKSNDLRGRRLEDFVDATDKNRIDEMLLSARTGRFNQCLVTCCVRDATIAFDAAFIPHQYNCHSDTVDVCLRLQGEVRHVDTKSSNSSGVEALPTSSRNRHTFVDINGTSHHETQADSSAQESDDSIYAVVWDIVDAAASSDIVRSFGARAVVMEAQQMQTLIFAQETRERQRAVARSLLARTDRSRIEALRDNVAIDGLRPVVWQERHTMETLHNLQDERRSAHNRIIEDVVSAYRVFHNTRLFRCNPCLRGLHNTCEMLGFFGPLPHHRRAIRPALLKAIQTFESDV
eukprot:TRINITY_DN4955_c0_g2_i1.p1 TRINITY_DN4955_c0_g2~~TRINITY_DN4955_c0_g2_i1.p1  ORF type:complete len:584 (-),score=31.16 TRINITY_DN4955_c0_g2_i1:52-1614(-)